MLNPILPEVERLRLMYYCAHCGAGMLPTRTLAGERSLTCSACQHEVAWSTRLESCKVAELVLPTVVDADWLHKRESEVAS